MKKEDKIGLTLAYIGVIIMTLIGIASAITLYGGECHSIEFPNSDPINYSVEGNSSDMNGFTYNKTGTNITYCFHQLYKPDNFTITFYNYQEVIVDDSQSKSYSRGGCSYNKNYNWKCSDWEECINGEKIRNCKKKNNCRNIYGKPDETKDCLTKDINTTEKITEPDEPIDKQKKSNLKEIFYVFSIVTLLVVITWMIIKKRDLNKNSKTKTIK